MSYYDKKVPLEIIGDGDLYNRIYNDTSLPVYTLYYDLSNKTLYYLSAKYDDSHNIWTKVGEAPI